MRPPRLTQTVACFHSPPSCSTAVPRGRGRCLTELGSVIIARRLSGEGEFDEIVADHDGVELQAFGLVDRPNYEV